MRSPHNLGIAFALSLSAAGCLAGEIAWTDLPASRWKGNVQADVPALKCKAAAAVALPIKDAKPLIVATAEPQAPGVYEVRLTLRPSHAGDAAAFSAGLRVKSGDSLMANIPGAFFARVHQPETRLVRILHTRPGPLDFRLEAYADAGAVDKGRTLAGLKKGGPQPGGGLDLDGVKPGADMDLDLTLTPERAVYYLVDKVEFRPLSRSGRVTSVTIDKIRYNPGDRMKASVGVADMGSKGGDGAVTLFLEHNVADRTKVQSLPVKLTPAPQHLAFEIALPRDELGYALVAEYASADGADRSEAAEYFCIASNFNRVALFGANPGGTRDSTPDEETVRAALDASRADYYNASEYPFWAQDDLLALTPTNDYWFSGQANYHYNKQTLQRQIRLAHEQGIAMVTYGKWCVDGPIGWEIVYDRPLDFQGAYGHPIAMWEGVNTIAFDWRRNGEEVPYSPRPGGGGSWFDVWWNEFIGITPDATPHMVRLAAEEMVRSIDMFGWDGVRWDGHPRGGGPCGGGSDGGGWGKFTVENARKTQALVRYFKDIIGAKYPAFGHGYNYYFAQDTPNSDWAYQDYELDELARGGGLLMNESIGNATGGWTFRSIARNLQVEGDLSRERGGYLLGISFAKSPRDVLIESALWAAAGCRPYNSGMTRETRRYCTRFAQYTFDENLRRLATPEKVLAPQAETRLWWQPFVYETPLVGGKRQLVLNLLNLPLEDTRPARDAKVEPKWEMPKGTDPVTFALTLPSGMRATGASLIDPQTLAVTPLVLKDNRLEMPAVANWSVATVELAVEAGAPSLGELYGPAKTFGVPRPSLPTGTVQRAEVILDPKREVWEVNKDMSALAPAWSVKQAEEQAAFEALPLAEQPAALLKKRATQSPADIIAQWWKGGSLPDDLALKDKAFAFGNLAPERNGRLDIYYGRGPIDYRLHMTEVFAGLDRFNVHDAPFWGGFRGGSGGMGLGNAVPWSRYPEFDLLLFTGIPYGAIGAENCYGMVEYVKAGGAVFFTGGEYAFGKGGYLFTVLDRDLLPVLCTEMKDTRTSVQPVPLEPGKDFAELQCKADFAAKPSFWVHNQVVLKDDPGIKVFLTSAKGPVLVGWQVGKGRVACLLVDYRGKSEKGVTAFFDWADWPGLARAVFAWLAPEAGKVGPPRSGIAADEVKKLTQRLEQKALGDLGDLGTPAPSVERAAKGRNKPVEDERVATLRRLLSAPAAALDSTVLLDQLLMAGGLPDDVRWGAIDGVLARPPANLADRIKTGLKHQDNAVRQIALQCLGTVDPAALARELNGSSQSPEVDALGRMYALTLALPLAKTPELVEDGRRLVMQWNASEKDVIDKWTGGKGFSPAAPELPGLDADSLFRRVAWLAYLSRYDAKSFGAQFVREWLMTGPYQDYCWRSIGNKKAGDWARLAAYLGRLRDLTKPDVEALLKAQPDAVAEGFGRAHFTLEFREAMNVLGAQDKATTAGILAKLKTASNPDLAAFAAARLGGGK